MTRTITITRHNGQLVIGFERRITNLPADRTLVAIVDKYGNETQLALTDAELAELRAALTP
jgi:hypothetical protein